ncbi:ribosomal protein S18 acetylase RimI-like enzyme [Halarchaeum rubridurum]|uniref:N-acetyltransferase n=1 Tax=Halarchaeum rubridurum TaxID=489911 RepID=A0A830G472_9EURY|nr:GNAT family N-acetyltransferase [Halarchaeum rubridurum]MBP1955600.1 ribosomal protein S18 acetylase RimI-like enzyme [Halarchaeum rubridurum]GGM73646.1 N-acetyltransferase [Halarchaeum rubridurum]
MEYALLGSPPDAPRLRLDWRRFAYAGKFVTGDAGKAVAVADGVRNGKEWPPDARDAEAEGVLGAVSFSPHHADDDAVVLRYVTVRDDRRGEGIGARLCAFAAERLLDAYARVRIDVNNPYAYEALHKAGFGYTGERAGLAELVLERPAGARAENYADGLAAYRERDLDDAERAFLDARDGPPAVVDAPAGEGER